MATKETGGLLTENFLLDLYHTALKNEYVLAMVCEHIQADHLPDRDFQTIHKALQELFYDNRKCPSSSLLEQAISRSKGALYLLRDIESGDNTFTTEECTKELEKYIKQVKFQKTYRDIGEFYNRQQPEEAYEILAKYAKWLESFSLVSKDFVDVIGQLGEHHLVNKAKKVDEVHQRAVDSFYIDELDKRNKGQSLRKQLTCFLASTGVGKSHIARWIGKNACQCGGLNGLHIQLEGGKEEVVDAYSASLVGCSAYTFSNGLVSDEDLQKTIEELKDISGHLFVKSFSRFGKKVTTDDIYKAIQDCKKETGTTPDFVIIDSMDLVYLPASKKRNSKDERQERIEVARVLKDLASDENVWMVVTYQSTIEDREKLNDEKFVLSEYNCSEAKGISRPLTHLITLNQTANESRENTMRINVAKSRFFKKGDPFKIATDYDHELFYDRRRTLNLNKVI